ncbi:MAG: leucine-rich repeat protein, partial [bacterium]
SLKSITIPDSVTEVEEGSTFSICTSLEEIVFSRNIVKFPVLRYQNLNSLKRVVVPAGITREMLQLADGVELVTI